MGSENSAASFHEDVDPTMVERRMRPYLEQVALRERREELRRLSRRNQALGLVLIAAAIFVWWLFHTRPGWIFPSGWWRL
jgi:hypothetical protein